jgi:hypothetical protein
VKVQLGPKKQDQERTQDGKDDTGGVKRAFSSGAYKQVNDKAGHNGANYAEDNGPEQREMQMHDGLGHEPGDETNYYVPDQV